jgi:hypothetical protein
MDPERAKRCGVDGDPALVVGGASSEQPTVPERGLERRGGPSIQWTFGLDVVVGVEKYRGRTRGPVDLSEDGRVSARELQQARIDDTGGHEDVASGLCRRADIRRVIAGIASRGDLHEAREFVDGLGHTVGDASLDV